MKDPNKMTFNEIMIYVASGYEVEINDGNVRLVLKNRRREVNE